MIDQKLVDRLFDQAKLSIPFSKARIVAAIIHPSMRPFVSCNSAKTHPIQARFSKNEFANCLHAEVAATVKALRTISVNDLAQSTLYIVRAKMDDARTWKFGSARPCIGCQECISRYKFKNVFYSDEPNLMQRYKAA